MTTLRAPIAIAAGVLALTAWLASSQAAEVSAAQQVARPQGWNDATHGAKARPDYQRLFGLDSVHEIRITIAPEDYRAMREDLQTLGRGGRGRPGGPGGPGRGGGLRGDGFAPPPGGDGFAPPP